MMSSFDRAQSDPRVISGSEVCERFLSVAQAAFESGALPVAVAAARVAVDYHPSRNGLIRLANYVSATGDPEQVIRIYNRLLSEQLVPIDAPIALALGLAEAQRGDFDAALNYLWRVIALGEENDDLWFHIGSCYAMMRQFAAANHVFKRNIPLPLQDGRLTSTALLRLPARRGDVVKVADTALPFERSFELAKDTVVFDARVRDADLIHLISCDSHYFRLFARPLARSMAERSGVAAALHFHIVNIEPDDLRLLEQLSKEYEVPIACTAERVEFKSLTQEQIKTYLTCARFLLLPELMDHYEKLILVTDADQTIVRPIDRLIAHARNHDVALLVFKHAAFNILALISGSVCVANTTAGAKAFFTAVRDYIRERMTDPEAMVWHLDQAALAAAYLASSDLGFHLIPPKAMVSKILKPQSDAGDDETLFWSATYSIKANARKLEADEYRALAS